jgi:hypothetical protein
MPQFKAKFKLIFLPFVYITFCTLFVYTFLHWLLIIKLNAFDISEKFINFFIPAVLAFIPLIIWLRPRIKLLKLNFIGRRDPVGLMIILTGISVAVPTIIAQSYIETATGKLTTLDSISQINNFSATKYYTVKHIYSSKSMAHMKVVFSVRGKNKSDFNMSAYTAVPVFDHIFPDTNVIAAMRKRANSKTLVIINSKLSTMLQLKRLPADSIRLMRYVNPSLVMPQYGEAGKYGALAVVTRGYKLKKEPAPMKISPPAWLAIKYSQTISNSLSPAEKQLNFNVFSAKCERDFKHEPLDKSVYLSRLSYNADDLEYYIAAIKSRDNVVDEKPIVLLPVYEPFAKRNGNKLAWIFGSFAIGASVFLLILLGYQLRNI